MRRILIVGAGQAGLMLALSLQQDGYEVTVMSARTPEDLRQGRVMSTQFMFWPALALERSRGLHLWEDQAPKGDGQRVTLAAPPGEKALEFLGPWEQHGQSVDQRVKMAAWLELFEERGGQVVYRAVLASELEDLAASHDLTLVAAGRGDLVEVFDLDPRRTVFDRPQRMLSCVYLNGVTPSPDHPRPHVRINALPGVGELFVMPALTATGPCTILFWEAVPGGPLDCWQDRPSPKEHLARSLELMRELLPWEYERAVEAEPTDEGCTLYGGFPPVVRHPIGRLPAGSRVLGMADVVVLNDPIAGQGSNNAAHCAAIYHERIREHGDRPFDDEWMQATFDAYWDYARHSTSLSNALLGPLPEHVQRILQAATEHPEIATRFAAGYAQPPTLEDWLMDPDKAAAYLASFS
jgi:Styrene monooxygenase A putative substrate binding domain